AQLDHDKRVVFVLAELEEMTVPAIARIVGANTATVYSRLRAARARVATELARRHGDAAPPFAAAIAVGRERTPPPAGSERRVWSAVLMRIAATGSPGLATVGLSTLAKTAIATVAAAIVA